MFEFPLLRGGVLSAFFLLIWSMPASAVPIVVNQGFNVQPGNPLGFIAPNAISNVVLDGAAVPVPFYTGAANNNLGTSLNPTLIPILGGFGQNNAYQISFDAAAVFGPVATGLPTVESASLFLDFLLPVGNAVVNVNVNGTNLGNFALAGGSGNVPLVNGGSAPLGGESNNLFIALPSSLFDDLQTDSTFSLTVTRVSGAATFDGANIQAVLTPEPTSLALFGLAAVAGGGFAWRRRRNAQSA